MPNKAVSDELTAMGLKAMEVLKLRMQNFYCSYDYDFQSLPETYKDAMGNNLQDNVHFILADTPYIIRYNKYYIQIQMRSVHATRHERIGIFLGICFDFGKSWE